MNIDGAKVYKDGVKIRHDCEAEIRQIVQALKTLSPSPELSLRVVKMGRIYEGLLWGKAAGIPLGAYNRGASINQVIDRLYLRVKKKCLKVWKSYGVNERTKSKTQTYGHETMAIAG
jgi:hypothetical protein